MKKSFPVFNAKIFGLTTCSAGLGLIALLCLSGCIAAENRWQAAQMRQQIMDYYNDEIMENLIRAKTRLPYLHVDVTLLTATDAASITGSIGDGETPSFSRSSPSMMGALHTIARGVMRPFTYSVSPTRNTSVQVQASPVLGRLSADSLDPLNPAPATLADKDGNDPPDQNKESASATDSKSPDDFVKSKRTEVEGPNNQKQTISEYTPKPKEKKIPSPITIYDVYDTFLCKYPDALQPSKGCPLPSRAVPGTIKRWGTGYYYISNDPKSANGYYQLCKCLFTKVQSQSVEKAIEAKANAAAAALKAVP